MTGNWWFLEYFMNCIDIFYLVNSLGMFFCIFFNSRTRYNEPPAPRCFYVVK